MMKTNRLALFLLTIFAAALLRGATAQADASWSKNGKPVQASTTNPLPVQVMNVSTSALSISSTTLTTLCQSVSTTATVLAANTNRRWWAIYTTSGSVGIYWKAGTGASKPAGASTESSSPLSGGTSFFDTGSAVSRPYSGLVSAVCATGTCWVCTQEEAP